MSDLLGTGRRALLTKYIVTDALANFLIIENGRRVRCKCKAILRTPYPMWMDAASYSSQASYSENLGLVLYPHPGWMALVTRLIPIR